MSVLAEKQAHVWERDALDWYVEPPRATEQLLTVETFAGPIWDPTCGQGNIVRVLLAHGLEAVGSDIADRGFGDVFDFLGPGRLEFFANIVFNPPFFRAKGCEAFIRRALSLKPSGKVAAFTDIRFLAGADRAGGLYSEFPPSRVWIITPRVSCPPGAYLAAGNTAGNGSSDWCWLIWDNSAPAGPTQLGWLRQ